MFRGLWNILGSTEIIQQGNVVSVVMARRAQNWLSCGVLAFSLADAGKAQQSKPRAEARHAQESTPAREKRWGSPKQKRKTPGADAARSTSHVSRCRARRQMVSR